MAQAPKATTIKGFVQKGIRLTTDQLTLFDQATAGCGLDTRTFLVHLILSTFHELRRTSRSLSIPIPASFLREHFRRARIEALVDRGILTVEEHDQGEGRCREYTLDGDWLQDFLDDGMTTIDDIGLTLFNPISQTRTRGNRKTRTTTASRHKAAPLVRGAAVAIKESWFNPESTERHLERRRALIDKAISDTQRDRLTRQYRNDLACYQSVLMKQPERIDHLPAVRTYAPAYKPQKFGRLTEIGGGFQSCSREMKAAARRGVPFVHNYDLASSQPNFLVVVLERADIDATWLRDYLADPVGKKKWADMLGVSVDTWKAILYPTLMGARVPTPAQLPYSEGDLAEVFRKNVRDKDLEEVYGRFYSVTDGLRASLDQWHDYLVDVWAVQTGQYVHLQGKTYVENAVSVRLALEDLSPEGKRYELKARLAAFILQGLEVAVIHRLAAAAERWDYVVMSHEHDGLITRREIPSEAVEEATAEAGIPQWAVNLEEKPLEETPIEDDLAFLGI